MTSPERDSLEAEFATSCSVTPMTIYRHIRTDQPAMATISVYV